MNTEPTTGNSPSTKIRLQDYDTSKRFTARVVSSDRITSAASEDEVRELVLDVDLPELDFEVGQSVGVLAPADPAFGHTHHFRLYSVSDLPETHEGRPRIKLLVKRCNYVDEYSGEEYPGVASNYLCDLGVGDRIEMAGPYGLPFEVPQEHDANLILIGTGTGIAPFRTLIKHIYHNVPDWTGQVRLFYGARSGLELLYMNDERDDFSQYYDRDTFEAIKALSPNPDWDDPIAWNDALLSRGEELWRLLGDPRTYVYLAGLEKIRDELEVVLSNIAGSAETWQRRKAELEAGGRWVELLY